MPRAPKAAATASQTDQVETYIQSLQKAVAAEEAEAKTLGMSNKAKQEAIDLAKAQEAANVRKKPLSADEASKVKALADAYVDAKDKIEVYNKVQENAKETASFFGNTLESALEKATERGARLGDIFEGLAKSMEQAALKALILGEGRGRAFSAQARQVAQPALALLTASLGWQLMVRNRGRCGDHQPPGNSHANEANQCGA